MTKPKKLTKKEATLLYLQEEALSLRTAVPNLYEAKAEGDKLVIIVTGEATEAPKLSYKGVELDVLVQTTTEEPKPVAEISEAAKRAEQIRNRHGVVPFDSLHIPKATPAIGPDGNGQRRDPSSYDAWKKRFGR